ncbi:peptidase M16 domain protein [Granulicella tundricola MP5ACTX9]|uniref:Peptidase M16 domain protein n=2 Tax=Granulicella TaxID=940557 RepID=E8X2G6_GRATM|nr:peptidase M16 domain protein [Granulicella tundricola MP5ACTX9]
MTKWAGLALLPVLLAGVGTGAVQAQAKHAAGVTAAEPWKKIPIPPLHDFKPVQPTRIELANGLVIFLQPDHELPFIKGGILIRGGSRDEPADKIGLVSLYGQTWRTSGTPTESGEALDDALALKAASVETSGGLATTSLRWSSFSKDFDLVFGDAMDVLLHPAFKADKLALAKRQLDTGIARRNDDASGIAGREVSVLAYGKDSPYARETEYATVAAVKLSDLKDWHDRTVAPNNMIVSVSGDFDPAAMEAKLRQAFEGMKQGKKQLVSKGEYKDPKPGVYFVNKTDVDQSNVYIVGLGTERNNPDYYALSVMNEIFSGGFGSRVFQSVRTRLGLAYSVGGAYGASYDHPGLFTVGAATKSASTVAAVKAMEDEIGKLKTVPPTAAEMKSAKDQVLNSFVFNYDSPEKTLSEQVSLAFYGYPADFLEKYKSGIEQVTAADVTRVANKYIDEKKLAIVVVGNGAEFGGPLTGLGAVTDVDIAIPPPVAAGGPGGLPPPQ